eukprot:307327_1
MSFTAWCFNKPHTISYVFWFLMITICICTVILNIIGIRNLKLTSKNITLSGLSGLYVTIAIVFIISSISYVIHTAQSIFCSDLKSWTQTGLIGIDFYLTGLSMLYLLYLFRLKITFQHSKYSLSLCLFILCLMGFVIQLILILFATLYLMKNNIVLGLKLYSIFNITNFLFNIFLLILFTQKIYTLSKHSTAQPQINPNNKQHKKNVNTTIHLLLTPTIRNIICAFISLIGSNIISMFGIIRSEIIENEIIRTTHILLIVLDVLINSYCIYLQHSFADKQYKLLCNKLNTYIYQKMQKEIIDINVNIIHKNKNNKNINNSNDTTIDIKIENKMHCVLSRTDGNTTTLTSTSTDGTVSSTSIPAHVPKLEVDITAKTFPM